MAYYTKVLQPGETVKAIATLHWLVYSKSLLLFALAAVFVAGAWMVQDPDRKRILLIAAMVAFALMAVALVAEWLTRRGTEIVVTDRRVIYKRGLLSHHSVEMNVSKIETVDVEQSFLGRLLDYGTVNIKGTGESLELLERIGAPLSLRNAITVG